MLDGLLHSGHGSTSHAAMDADPRLLEWPENSCKVLETPESEDPVLDNLEGFGGAWRPLKEGAWRPLKGPAKGPWSLARPWSLP